MWLFVPRDGILIRQASDNGIIIVLENRHCSLRCGMNAEEVSTNTTQIRQYKTEATPGA